MPTRLSDLARRLFARTRRPAAPPTRTVLALTPLEDRVVPTAVVTIAAIADGTEGGGDVTYRLTRTDTTGSLTVGLRVDTALAIDGTAAADAGTDYTAPTAATFPTGQATVDVTVTPTDDATSEFTEALTLVVGPGLGYSVGSPASATAVILDNDAQVVTVTTLNDAAEGSDGQFQFTRTGGLANQLVVTDTVGGTATSGTDFTALSGSVTFAANSDHTDVPVAVTDDTVAELDEYVIAEIQAGTGYTIDAGTALVTIEPSDFAADLVEDDAAAFTGSSVAITVLDNDPGTQNGTLTITASTSPAHGTITLNSDHTFTYTNVDLPLNGSDEFTYTVSDGNGGTAIGTVIVVRLSTISTDQPSVDTPIGRVVAINDNPTIPAANTNPTGLTVVIIGGNADERNEWTQTARAHFGANAYLYNTVTDVPSLAAILAQFPPGSVGKLVIGGHGDGGQGVQLGVKGVAASRFNDANLTANAANAQTIKTALGGPTAVVECQSCSYGNRVMDMQKVADRLNAKVKAAKNQIGPWDDPDGGWVTRDPK